MNIIVFKVSIIYRTITPTKSINKTLNNFNFYIDLYFYKLHSSTMLLSKLIISYFYNNFFLLVFNNVNLFF